MVPSRRTTHFLIFLGSVAMMSAAYYMEHVMRLLPCPLCITQRIFFVSIGLMGLIAWIHHPKGNLKRIYPLLGIVFAIAGGYFAQHQLWLQSLPEDQVPACGPGLAYMFEVFPFMDAFKMLLKGDGTCAHVDKILGFSIAGWSLAAFIGFGIINLFQLVRPAK